MDIEWNKTQIQPLCFCFDQDFKWKWMKNIENTLQDSRPDNRIIRMTGGRINQGPTVHDLVAGWKTKHQSKEWFALWSNGISTVEYQEIHVTMYWW